MGRKSRKTKAKTSDFQKVKFRVGKKRPPPSNVTDVAFKSQSIYIPKQMKTVEEPKDGKMHKNIPELIGRIGHFNSNFRVDALTALRISFANDRDLMKQYLHKVIPKAVRSISDENCQVRKSCIALFRNLFSELNDGEISPFFDLIISHLFCAMTHIYVDVKKDSLQMVDICIESFPNLLHEELRDSLLNHFIELITTRQTNSAAQNQKREQGETRVLSMKLSSNETSIAWRNRVLKPLHDLLAIGKDPASLQSSWKPVTLRWDSKELPKVLIAFQSRKFGYPVHPDGNWKKRAYSLEEKKLSPWKLITTLLPLLIDSWHEATSDDSILLSEDGIGTMSIVLKIINILLKQFMEAEGKNEKEAAKNKIRENFWGDFEKYFFQIFPIEYSPRHQPTSKRRKKEKSEDFSSEVVSINLSVCELFAILVLNHSSEGDVLLQSVVTTYLSVVLEDAESSDTSMPKDVLEQCISVARLLLDNATEYETVESILDPCLTLFTRSSPKSHRKVKLLEFFKSLYFEYNKIYSIDNPVMTRWLCSLPSYLVDILTWKATKGKAAGPLCQDESCRRIILDVISSIRLAIVKYNMEVTSAFCEDPKGATEVLKTLKSYGDSLFCVDNENLPDCIECEAIFDLLMAPLIHYAPEVSPMNLKVLADLCHERFVPMRSVLTAVGYFFIRKDKECTESTMTLQFASSLIIGITKENLTAMQSSAENTSYKVVGPFSDWEFKRHLFILDPVVQQIRTLHDHKFSILRFFHTRILHNFRILPAKTAYSILKTIILINAADEQHSHIHTDIWPLLGQLISSILIDSQRDMVGIGSSAMESLKDVSVQLLTVKRESMQACVDEFHNCDLENQWQDVCRALQFMVSRLELIENLNACHVQLTDLLEKIENECGEASNDILERTKISVSAALRNRK